MTWPNHDVEQLRKRLSFCELQSENQAVQEWQRRASKVLAEHLREEIARRESDHLRQGSGRQEGQ